MSEPRKLSAEMLATYENYALHSRGVIGGAASDLMPHIAYLEGQLKDALAGSKENEEAWRVRAEWNKRLEVENAELKAENAEIERNHEEAQANICRDRDAAIDFAKIVEAQNAELRKNLNERFNLYQELRVEADALRKDKARLERLFVGYRKQGEFTVSDQILRAGIDVMIEKDAAISLKRQAFNTGK